MWYVIATITAKGNDTCAVVFFYWHMKRIVSLQKSVRVQDQNKYSIRSFLYAFNLDTFFAGHCGHVTGVYVLQLSVN